MKQGLSLRVSQHLALTPQLQQSIRLLQLSTLELGQEVEQMLGDNPFLELAAEEAEREEFGLAQADTPVSRAERDADVHSDVHSDMPAQTSAAAAAEETAPLSSDEAPDWEGDGSSDITPDDSEWGGDAPARTPSDADEADATELARNQESLHSYLHRQALRLRLDAEDNAALRFLIESLNDDGYLEDSLETLVAGLTDGKGDGEGDAEQHENYLHHFTVALGLLQNLEPVGVGARDLAECLRLQIQARANQINTSAGPEANAEHALLAVARAICLQPMELLARRDIKTLMQRCAASDVQVRSAIALIAKLEPKPGRRFVNVERNIVVPDVLVLAAGKVGGSPRFKVQINTSVMPKLRVHDVYANVLRNHRGGKDAAGFAALQQSLQEARWFIKNIQQRFDTILRVSTAIVERQKSFFVHGELAMRPLVLREIADELGLHESTISRVTTAKYMSTPFGTFELKYFFGSGLGTETGGNASSTAVRALIKQFISAESDAKPLSDNNISEMLKEQGIECARRTVAKYREGLKIAPASLRKAL
jgi:RNA polymerase sigma-54 factor